MNNQEYDQKKRECWKEFCKEHPLDATANGGVAFRYAFDRAYAIGMQEKDAEGEEMLICSNLTCCRNGEGYLKKGQCDKIQCPNRSKCLPDIKNKSRFEIGNIVVYHPFKTDFFYDAKLIEIKEGEDKPYLLQLGNKKEVRAYPIEVQSIAETYPKEPKPVEPKFKIGDKVKHIAHPHDDGIYRIDDIKKISDGFIYHIQGLIGISNVKESDLEPYTEPDASHETSICENHSDNTSQKEVNMNSNRNLSQETANCDKQFDTIIKDSFRNERRLNITTQMVKAIMQCPEAVGRIASAETDSFLDDILHDALYLTDRLIAKCEKGGNNATD